MLSQQYRERISALFKDLECLEANPAAGSLAVRRELDALRARLQELEAQFLHSQNAAPSASPSSPPRPAPPSLYEKDRVAYAYTADKQESVPIANLPEARSERAVSLPLIASGQTIGDIQIETPPERALTPDEMDLAQDVVSQVAQQIQNLRLLSDTERARAEAEEASRRFVHEGWASYLDAIHQRERIGYTYDRSSLTPYAEELRTDSGYVEPVLVTDQQIGALYLGTDPTRPLAEEEKALVSAVARQIAQQVENLRLLADASRARAEAEEAARELTRENWQTYKDQKGTGTLRFKYDSVQVSPFEATSLPDSVVLTQPLTVRGEAVGQLAVAGLSEVTPEGAQLAAAIAAQASMHLETLRLAEELRRRARELEELDRLKTAFLANMSHELRTPLNSIIGFADVIMQELDGPLTVNMNNDLQLIQKNGQHLLNLINDVLDMAKIEAGGLNLNLEKFRLHDTFDEVLSISNPLANSKKLALLIEPDSDRELDVYADRTRIRQVMLNLVNNALKFTEQGAVRVRATLQHERVLIRVQDSGMGIPPDKLEVIFKEFTQVDTSPTRKVGGTGLGLPISRRLIEMHGGRIWAESSGNPGEGASFYVELPLEARIPESAEALGR